MAIVALILFGKLLFFPRGAFPGMTLVWSVLAGLLGGALGGVAARPFVVTFSWTVFAAAGGVGFIFSLIENTFRETDD